MYPIERPRRLRNTDTIRNMVREVILTKDDFIYPIFINENLNERKPVLSMPGVFQYAIDELPQLTKEFKDKGINKLLLFGIPKTKDERGTEAYNPDGVIQRSIRNIKDIDPTMTVITDVCLCEYTSHGHCGLVENGSVLNDPSLELLTKTVLTHVEAGADIVAPSDMMDGRIGFIRNALDENNFADTLIMAYSAKYASTFYGPFRDAAHSAPQFGDRKSYQMDYRNSREAMREVRLDVEEGADIIIIKPAMGYMDIIYKAKNMIDLPVCAYSVSGEYAMIKAASQNGWIDEKKAVLELFTGIKRAGADIIITYYTPQLLEWLDEKIF